MRGLSHPNEFGRDAVESEPSALWHRFHGPHATQAPGPQSGLPVRLVKTCCADVVVGERSAVEQCGDADMCAGGEIDQRAVGVLALTCRYRAGDDEDVSAMMGAPGAGFDGFHPRRYEVGPRLSHGDGEVLGGGHGIGRSIRDFPIGSVLCGRRRYRL